jgi:sugar O-acyltransferase (sialic acid O-acetyltransferase NeuD family)
MSGLILVAASGLAREVLAVLGNNGPFDQILMVDDDPARAGTLVDGAEVVGGLEAVALHPDHQVLVCAGRGVVRRALVSRLSELGVGPDRYATVIHPGVDVPDGCAIGVGSILLAQVAMTAHVSVGRHAVLMPNVTLTHDVVIGDYATLCAGVSLGGSVRVGQAAYLGMNASVRENLTIGDAAVLGMGAALVADLPPRSTWTGVPARRHDIPRPMTWQFATEEAHR